MRTTTTLLVALLALAGAAGARAKAPAPPPAVPGAAIKAVKGSAPKGWTVSVKGDTLIVRRDAKVALYNPIGRPPNLTPQQLASEWDYEIRLRFRPRVGPEDFAKQQRENEQLGAKIEKMREGLRAAGIRHKFDEWLPNSDLQEEMVAAYRAEQKKLHRLPDRYSDTHSIDVEDSQGHVLLFADGKEHEECAAVKTAVLKPFPSYRAEVPER